MARIMRDAPMVHRAIITQVYEAVGQLPERRFTQYAGPFDSQQPAKAAVTRAKNSAKTHNENVERYGHGQREHVEHHFESAPLVWERVE